MKNDTNWIQDRGRVVHDLYPTDSDDNDNWMIFENLLVIELIENDLCWLSPIFGSLNK